MKNLARRVLAGIAGALATAIIATMSAPAYASVDTYTPHGGAAVTFISDDVYVTLLGANQTFTCEQSNLSGTVFDPGLSRPFGAQAVVLDQNMSSDCVNPIMGETTFEPTGAWNMSVTGPSTGSTWPTTVTDVRFFVEMAGCSFNIAGTVEGEISETVGNFAPTRSTLTIIDDPLGFICPVFGLVKGDEVDISGSWMVNGLSITSP